MTEGGECVCFVNTNDMRYMGTTYTSLAAEVAFTKVRTK